MTMRTVRILRVLTSLIIALLFRHLCQHVHCSEQILCAPGQSPGDCDSPGRDQDLTHQKAVEECLPHKLYDSGQEKQRPDVLEQPPIQKTHQGDNEGTANPLKAEVVKEEVLSEVVPATAAEPEHHNHEHNQSIDQAPPASSTYIPTTDADKTTVQAQSSMDSLDPPPGLPDHCDTPSTQPTPVSTTRSTSINTQTEPQVPSSDSKVEDPISLVTVDREQYQTHKISDDLDPGSAASSHPQQDQIAVNDPDQGYAASSHPQPDQRALGDLDQSHAASSRPQQDRQTLDAGVVNETDPSVPGEEDIPTLNEWKKQVTTFDEWKKQVMEVEKEKSRSLHASTNGAPQPARKVQKTFKNNYASVKCGAKVLAANNEAKSTSAILKEDMDLYMLNPCTHKLWFVVELCENIQVKQLDFANFELFSSTPKDFLVSFSDRYPTNNWVTLGTFHGRDERTIQSFPLDEQLYGKYAKMYTKYIKVEVLSHFRSEYYCPLSLVRVFGTSMVEEYEEITDSQYPPDSLEYPDDDDDDDHSGYQLSEDKAARNLFDFTVGGIWNMLNGIATSTLGRKPEQNKLEGNPPAPLANSPIAALCADATSRTIETGQSVTKEVSPVSPFSTVEKRQSIALVKEVREGEEVTVIEEKGGDKEEEKQEEQVRREARRRQKESQPYCPLPCESTLPLYCVAALHRWCSVRPCTTRAQTCTPRAHADTLAPTQTPLTAALPLIESVLEPDMDQIKAPEAHPERVYAADRIPDWSADLLLEHGGTTAIPTLRSLSYASLDDDPIPHIKDPHPTLQVVMQVPEMQKACSANLTPRPGSLLQPPASETAPSDFLGCPTEEHQVRQIPTDHIRAADVIPPPAELPTAISQPNSLTDGLKTGLDNRESQVPSTEPSQGEQVDSFTHGRELDRQADLVDEPLLSGTNGNGKIHQVATDVYGELQSTVDYDGRGEGNGNGGGAPADAGTVHDSNQKESVFMRLNNRIKSLEMNMSLSSRYLEELSQRYRKQMEEMQRAFDKTIVKLQNTSGLAEERDQKQTATIHALQSRLQDTTQLAHDLVNALSRLQREVSDQRRYLVASLVLGLSLGLLLSLTCRGHASPVRPANPAVRQESDQHPSHKRCFTCDVSLKHSDAILDDSRIVEPLVKVMPLKPLDPSPRATVGGPERISCVDPCVSHGPPCPDLPPAPTPLPPNASAESEASLLRHPSEELPMEPRGCRGCCSSTCSKGGTRSDGNAPTPLTPNACGESEASSRRHPSEELPPEPSGCRGCCSSTCSKGGTRSDGNQTGE